MATPRARLGAQGEELAQEFLRKKGYEIVATNYRCKWGEIDIVARDGKELVFVEVRSRRGAAYGAPEESLTRNKIRHLTAASLDYLQQHLQQHRDKSPNWRIDFIGVRFGWDYRVESIDHLPHAVEL